MEWWIPAWFEPLADEDNPVRVVVPSRGQNPVAAIIPLLEMPGVEVVKWGGSGFRLVVECFTTDVMLQA